MQIGSLVELVRDISSIQPECKGRPNPVKGIPYTVSFFGRSPWGVSYICLEEMHPDSCFVAKYFREIQPPMPISIESIISETVEA